MTQKETIDAINNGNELFQVEIKENSTAKLRRIVNKPSDEIMQTILQASKLLEGRVTLQELLSFDVPTFESLVDNEFANIDKSYEEFRKEGKINAYTKNETGSLSDSKALKELNNATTPET